ncbi:MAG: hypothetical protein ACOCY7_02205 [Halodesulfurarchaeum sp.]
MRRRSLAVLAGLGAVGLASAGAGLGTTAFYSDTELFEDNALVAGELDLKVDWQVTYTGPNGFEYVGAFPDYYTNDPDDPDRILTNQFGDRVTGSDDVQDPVFSREAIASNLGRPIEDPQVEAAYRSQFADVPDDLERPIIDIDDVKPGDSGEVTFSLHLFDNPGYIWMNGELLENRENSVTEPESKDPDENDSMPFLEEIDDSGELAEEIFVTIWYDEDGDNVHDEDEAVILRGSLLEVLEILDTDLGVPLDGDRATEFGEVATVGDGGGSLEGPRLEPGNPNCADLGLLPAIKIEDVVDGTTTYQTPVGAVTVEATGVKDGDEVTDVAWTSTFPVQAVIVKAGASANVYEELDEPARGAMAGVASAPGAKGISHLSICYDAEPAEEGGGRECFENSTTQFIGFEWSLPRDHANEIQTDSVAFDLGFYTEQCRHNDGLGLGSRDE